MYANFQSALERLECFCENSAYQGYDPYDGLNSRVFRALPWISDTRLAKLIWIQGFKRSPINLRPLLGVDKAYNPKAMGLFLSGYCARYRRDEKEIHLEKIRFFIDKILSLASPGFSGSCWGYNFDWQARAFFQPKYTPTVVASTFVAHALLDAFDILGEARLLKTARSTCDFILRDLNRSQGEGHSFAFSYSPLDHSVVYNASLLGSRLLARVYAYTGEEALLEAARQSVSYCCAAQKEDGSWPYGTYSFHQWVDNFHTGYNLECLADYMRYTRDDQYADHLERGVDYYVNTFFTEDGKSKYYNNSVYPVDIHAPAQLVMTLIRLNKFEEHRQLVDRVLDWTVKHMQDEAGFFYFQKKRYFTCKIPYIRWAQAWMFYALSHYLLQVGKKKHKSKSL